MSPCKPRDSRAIPRWRTTLHLLLLAWLFGLPVRLPAQVVITEFLADNRLGLKDDDGDHEDWIELHNPGSTAVRLAGWHLTDNAANPPLWELPDIALNPGEFLLVFASGKDRRTPGRPFHTNFRLATGGEYLALIRPDLTVATAFAPSYPPQLPDVSFGFPVTSARVPLVATGASGRFQVPAAETGTDWTRPEADDSGWAPVLTGVGWDRTGDSASVVIADSAADWQVEGQQGYRGWHYGTYSRNADTNGVYGATDFAEFGAGEWDGTRWRTPAAGTARVTVSATDGRPGGVNSGDERWVIRRWRSTIAGPLSITWSLGKRAAGGSGIGVRLFQNGQQRDSLTLTGSDTTPVLRAVTLTNVVIGDAIDLALTPAGTGSAADDTADEAGFGMIISAPAPVKGLIRTDVADLMRGHNASGQLRIPFGVTNLADLGQLELSVRHDDGFVAWLNGTEVARRNAPVEAAGGVVADQADDWAGTSDVGFRGWYYGWYDQGADADRRYDAHTDFSGTDPAWQWNGSAWELASGQAPRPRISRDAWRPGDDGAGNGRWVIRRWVAQAEGRVRLLFGGERRGTACGNGVTFRVMVNGNERFARTLAASDTAGLTTSLTLDDLVFGDFVDFVLDPTGTDGVARADCDDASFHVEIQQDASPGLRWNSTATRSRSAAEAVRPEVVDLTRSRDRLVLGTNLLAVQVLNAAADDADLLLVPELTGRYARVAANQPRYFTSPTPGGPNAAGVETPGPVIETVEHRPRVPADAEDLVISAIVRPTLRPIASVTLTYRVMFAAEQALPMFDDGRHDDGAAGDGMWGARIPASAATAGQMIRWAVTASDTTGQAQRFPPYPDSRRSPQYDGTIVADPGVADSGVPVLHWFAATPSAADGDAGSRGAVFYEGEFHDNILVTVHGQSTRGFPKHSYDFDFNPGDKFRWREGQPRVDDFNLLTTWADKSHLRNVLAYETYAQAGAAAHFAFAVRVHQNGKFHSLANLVENGDDNFLSRLGLDPQGALYKMYNTASDVSGGEKKTRKGEGTQDLSALISGCANGTSAAKLAFLFDNLDVPGVIDFLAARALTGDTDCCHKNYYLYRDSNGSREWTAFPWDVDLSFGRVWTCNSPCLAYYDETIYTNTGLFVGDGNTVFSVVLGSTPTRQMYLRRLRTLMDELTQPPGIPPAEDRWLARTTQLRDQLAPAAALDLAKWGTWGRRETITQAVDRIHKEFLPGRRNFLYLRNVPGTLPQAQPTNVEIRLAGVEFRGPGGDASREFIALTNANNVAVDLSDWRLEGAVRFRFRPGTVLASRSGAIVAASRPAFRARPTSPRGGESRLVLGDYSGELSGRGGSIRLIDRTGRTVHTTNFPGDPSPAQRFLRVTKLMFHPPPGDGDTEFAELRNTGTTSLDLTGVRFTEGILFDFSSGALTTLAPGARVLVVANLAVFRARYGTTLPVAGQFAGTLDNAGERIRLEDAAGEPILDFRYEPDRVPAADGLGFALAVAHEDADESAWRDAAQWRASRSAGGSPGTEEAAVRPSPEIVINEVLTHTDLPQVDAVELHNPGNEPADLGGWWLTDDAANPRKYRLPAGTVLPPGGFAVFDESHFNSPTNAPTSFRFSSHGDSVWLFAADGAGNLTGYATGTRLDAAANGVSFGRHTNSVGVVRYVPQRTLTLGAPNAGPRTGPVVFNEIHFAPDRGDDAFLELRNLTASPVPLFDPAAPTNTWRIEGVDFEFPPGTTIAPGGLMLVTSGDPNTFRARHGIGSEVPVLGPWRGRLQPNGERLALTRPDAPDPLPDGGFVVPFLTVDEVRLRDESPWPVTATTPGASLVRVPAGLWADDPASWRASDGPPTPGVAGQANRAPIVSAGADVDFESVRYPLNVALAGSASDDGSPADPGRLTVTWSQADGPGPAEFDEITRPATTVRLPGPGRYTLRLTAFDGELGSSAQVTIHVARPGTDLTPIPAGATWRYFAEGREPAAGWRNSGFEDRAWPIGAAQLGYGDGDEATVLGDTVNGARLFTAYFRRTFVIGDPAEIRSLNLRLLRDDGAAGWINGLLAFRSNLPDGVLSYTTPATATISGVDETTYLEQALDPAQLLAGTNTIAVEVHQQNASSSDISFDLELRATAQPVNQPPTITLPASIRVTAGSPFRLVADWSDDGLPQPAALAWSQLAGPGPAGFSATNVAAPLITLPAAGNYDLRFAVSDGASVIARDLRLVAAIDDTAEYQAWRTRHFSAAELANPAVAGDLADPDGDRQSNLAEFRSGTDPRSGASVLAVQASLGPAGEVRLRFGSVAGHTYRVEWTDSVATGAWQELARSSARPDDGPVTITDAGAALGRQTRFYRVVTP